MSRVSVGVPQELMEPVRETVLLLYQATAESLHQALGARAEGEADTGEAHSHRARIDELDELARALAVTSGPVELSAPRDLIHDVLYGALIDAGERLAALSGRGWRGGVPAERIQEAAGEVLSLHALLGGLESDSP
jgi:hypothetical protein